MAESKQPKDRFESIDENLRRAYDEVVNEGVPDRFNDLLKRLREGDIPLNEGEDERNE